MTPVPRRVAVPFLLAAAGVLVMFGVVIDRVLGHIALLAYVLLLVVPAAAAVSAGAVSAARRRRTRPAGGRTCTCCTGTVHDPIQVI